MDEKPLPKGANPAAIEAAQHEAQEQKLDEIGEFLDAIKTEFSSPADEPVYRPIYGCPPPEEQPVIYFNEASFLSSENVGLILAYIGSGKSAHIAALAASHIEPNADCMGWRTNLAPHLKILIVESEMSRRQTYGLLAQIHRRAGRTEHDHRIIVVGTKSLTVAKRWAFVQNEISGIKDLGLVIFDGAGDLINDINNIDHTGDAYDSLKEITAKVPVVATLHTNAPDACKARGHWGSELLRRCDSALWLHPVDREAGIYEATTDFDFGKNREAMRTCVNYHWSDDAGMFVTATDYAPPPPTPIRKREKQNELAEKIDLIYRNAGVVKLSHAILTRQLAKSSTTSKRILKTAIDTGILTKEIDGGYTFNK